MTFRDVAAWLPRRIRHQFRTRGGDTRFLIWVSFVVTFLWARFTISYVPPAPNVGVPGHMEFGGKTIIFGYHPHHIVTGIFLLAVAGWIGLHYGGKTLTRVAGVLYGVGLGLIVDEAGFVVEGFTYRDDFPEVFVIVVTIGGLLMSTVYFPSFWTSVQGRLARWGRRAADLYLRWRGRPPDPPATASSPSGSPEAAPSAKEASVPAESGPG